MAILRAKKVEIRTFVVEMDVSPETAEALETDAEVEAYVDARGGWDQVEETAELVENWTIE